jgi:hypothetical protein
LVEIPKKCKILTFDNVFETCLKHYKMIVIAVYKRHEETSKHVREDFYSQNHEANKQKED